MRSSILAVALVVFVAVFAMPAPVTATAPTEVHYYVNGAQGQLVILEASGNPFWARDVNGVTVAQGYVNSASFVVPVNGAAPGALLVSVGGPVQEVQADPSDWWWM